MPIAIRLAKGLAFALPLVVITLGLWPTLTGTASAQWDALHFYAPSQTLVADFAREGRLVLWNPWMGGGRPDCADPQVGAFSPWNVGIGWLVGGGHAGFHLYWWLCWALGAVGMMVLCRHRRVPVWGSAVAGLAFATCGYFTGHGQHSSFIQGLSFLPWILWRLDVGLLALFEVHPTPEARAACRRRAWIAGAQCGAIFGLSALGGYPGLVISNGLLAVLWTLAVAFDGGRQGREPLAPDRSEAQSPGGSSPGPGLDRSRILGILVLGVLAVAIALAVLAPTYYTFFAEGRGYSHRTDVLDRQRVVEDGSLTFSSLATFASPELAVVKTRHRDTLWPGLGNSLVSVHVCLGVLALALAAPFGHSAGRRWRLALLGISAFFLGITLAEELPLRGWLYDLFLPFRYFRHASIFRGHAALALVLAAAEATKDLAPDYRSAGRRLALAAAGFATLLAPVAWRSIRRVAEMAGESGAHIERAQSVALGACLGAALAFAALAFARSRRLRHGLVLGLVALFALEGADAVIRSRPVMMNSHHKVLGAWEEIEAGRQGPLPFHLDTLDRLARPRVIDWKSNLNLTLRRPTLANYDPFTSDLYRAWIPRPHLVAMVTGSERIWFAPDALDTPADRQTLMRFAAETERRGAPILLLHDRHGEEPSQADRQPSAAGLVALASATPVAVSGLDYRPEALAFDFETPEPGWLWVTDRWTGGWRAELDGEPVAVERGNFLFRAVRVGAGRQRLEFSYHPPAHPALVLSSWGLLLLVSLVSVRERFRSPASSPPDRPADPAQP